MKSRARRPRINAPLASAKKTRRPVVTFRATATGLLLLVVAVVLYSFGTLWTSIAPRTRRRFPIITYAALGQVHTGQLGNQMFQLASTVGLALDHGLPFDFLRQIETIQIGQVFDIRGNLTVADVSQAIPVNEENLNHQRFILPTSGSYVSIGGYLQSPLYFAHHGEYIRRLFSIRPHLLDQALPKMPEVFDADTACLHVRRGDYVQLSHIYTQLDGNYYERALSSMPNISKVVVMSNDVEWCRNEFKGLPYEFLYSSASFLHDFTLLSQCSNIVIANSSFSWWAAFLNTRVKRVVAPVPWYKLDGPLAYANTDDMYLPEWHVINAHL